MSEQIITKNKKANLDYHIHEVFDAGMILEGWEVKALRLGHAQINEAHGILRQGEVWIVGLRIQPPPFVSTHRVCDELRTKKLLLKKRELKRLEGLIQRQGYTLIPLNLYWKNKKYVKCQIGLGSGKKLYDKRQDLKEKEWQREKARLFKHSVKK